MDRSTRRPVSTSSAAPPVARWWIRSRRPDPLGAGVWRRAEDRFRRAVDRYHQVLERVEVVASEAGSRGDVRATNGPSVDTAASGPAAASDLTALEVTGAQQADLLARVHEVCLTAQALAPSDGEDIPPGPGGMLLDVHRALARAATLVAQAAESLTMVLVTLRNGRLEEAAAATVGARRATEQAGAHIAQAEALIQRSEARDGA
jgi:hypothetical protein